MDEKYYEYTYAKSLLKENIIFEFNDEDFIKINICAYEVDKSGKFPFLKYILINEDIFVNYKFPWFKISKNTSSCEIIKEVCEYMYKIISKNNENKLTKNIKFDGYYEKNNLYYIFLDLTNCELFINDIDLNNELCLVLIDEIVHMKHTMGYQIKQEVGDFFLNNKEFLFLTNVNKETYEIPTVAYLQENVNCLQFVSTFGISVKNKSAILGPFYYFTDYENALLNNLKFVDETEIVEGCNSLKRNKTGLIRFALFLGNTLVISNVKDEIDLSEIKKERLHDIRLNKVIEELTLKVSDHNGNWTKKYDSCFLGPIIMDNGVYLEDTPLYVVKNLNQQVPLSYHYINKTTITILQNGNYIQNSNYIL